jgi:serine/threonine protein kinase
LLVRRRSLKVINLSNLANEYYFMILEYCDLGNLLTYQAKIKTRIFSLIEGLEIMVQVMQGLRVIHEKNYIHRDIKSENVLIKSTDKGKIYKIADFGFARPVKSGTASTVCGTQKYMAP